MIKDIEHIRLVYTGYYISTTGFPIPNKRINEIEIKYSGKLWLLPMHHIYYKEVEKVANKIGVKFIKLL